MRRKTRHLSVLSAALAFAAMLIACGSGEVTDEPNSTSPDAGQADTQPVDTSDTSDGSDTSDANAPEVVVQIHAGPEELTNEKSAEFEFDCEADLQCEYQCQLTEGEFDACSSPAEYDELDDGEYQFAVRARADGDWSTPAHWEWTIDTSAPEIVVLERPDESTTETEANFEFECANTTDCSFQCALEYDGDMGQWESCSTGHSIEELAIGDYQLHLEATDDLGNQGLKTVSWSVVSFQGWQVSTGIDHSCAIRADHTLWCWGTGSRGRLGHGDNETYLEPEQVGSDSDWKQVAAGGSHTCAVRTDDTLWCWGRNRGGQLGHDDDDDRDAPEQTGDETDWAMVSTGGTHTCGIRQEGTVWCWGTGRRGRLGHGDDEDRWAPEQVGGDSDWVAVSAGLRHTCGLRDDATLWCWGRGTGSDTPGQVGSDSDWDSISAKRGFTCAIRDDATLWCWGGGEDGQLGLGDTEDRDDPEQVGSDADWSAVNSGMFHACATRDDDTLWCWGDGDNGRLGHGDTDRRLTPEEVTGPF